MPLSYFSSGNPGALLMVLKSIPNARQTFKALIPLIGHHSRCIFRTDLEIQDKAYTRCEPRYLYIQTGSSETTR